MTSPNLIALDARRRTPEQVREQREATKPALKLSWRPFQLMRWDVVVAEVWQDRTTRMWCAVVYGPAPLNTRVGDDFETFEEAVTWAEGRVS